ncbi:hypothetical protein SAMN02745247_02804 [Butyrivibrio hungatei DSM 14810]|uniref:Uncharacterized protein n=1 Tax=Butyrivibrio hungatei DSM 14810 TaxID=1121132 RepID=A0A1M7T168_9FIRM|nr:hypothetical protein [Butyrivibrio hungatei]SHN64503.1 hypothetical protein SAMN02745247_02804 [Butyrivibrio hungatei DSM 14810]
MGGRGASSGISVKGKIYGSEYKSLLTYGNIKFVVPIDGNTTAPMETMSQNRVYVTLDGDGNPKFITYYDKENKRRKQVDLDVPHKGMSPHTHHGYFHNENDLKKGAANSTTQEKALINLVNSVWKEKKNNAWTKWKNRK